MDEINVKKRKRSLSDSDKYEFLLDDVYSLPNKLSNMTDPKYNKIYESVKKNLSLKQINLESLIQMDNILDNERLLLVEKYSIMINSQHDLSLYIKLRDDILDLINHYTNTDIKQRKLNLEKKTKLNNSIDSLSMLEDKILLIDNQYLQQQLYVKYVRLQNMCTADTEYSKLKELIELSVNLPYKTMIRQPINNISNYLINIKNRLDAELYGMGRIKEELLMAINHRLINPNSPNSSIALVGPAGVGKTRIISLLADILGCGFTHISLGGVNDSSYLAGHSYTYEGAKPGKIVESLIKMGTNDGILFFDEIDKISSTANGKEVSNQLLHITDFTQNNHFTDRYLSDIPIDLSKIWFIFSLNSIGEIDPILSDRLNYINIDDYTLEDKINICRLHLIPDAFKRYNLDAQRYIFENRSINRIIQYKNSSGIRELKRSIDKIFNRLSLLENSSKTLTNYLSFNIDIKKTSNIISESIIDKFLS